jgi:hypothetical protein
MADRWRIAVHEAGHFEEAAQTCGASEPPAGGWGKGVAPRAQRETLSAPRVRLLPPAAILFAAAGWGAAVLGRSAALACPRAWERLLPPASPRAMRIRYSIS